MGSYGQDWGTLAWSATTIAGSAIATGASADTEAISNDDKLDTEVSISVSYGTTATEGVKVYVLRDVDGLSYEARADAPWGFEMPKTVSTAHRRTFTVPASIGRFKVQVYNNSGASVTATVRYRQATGVTA